MATEADYLRVRSITEVQEFADAIEAVMLEERETKIKGLCSHVRSGLALEAARVEAEMATLEKIPEILRKYAGKARVSR